MGSEIEPTSDDVAITWALHADRPASRCTCCNLPMRSDSTRATIQNRQIHHPTSQPDLDSPPTPTARSRLLQSRAAAMQPPLGSLAFGPCRPIAALPEPSLVSGHFA